MQILISVKFTPAESRMSCAAPKAPAGEEKKTSWPEVVGKSIEEAKEIILKDMPDADIFVLPAGSPVTLDFRSNRVRIFVDTVASTPHIG
ncbi:subtilisin-chymotrypsin inhibitor-2B-like isoform X1 [Hordeum vulgare subsp. vulgare]|nr:subtilisin-chymotrypsin inhibitor-2B-like isoform X1 [Hordeum vulgare subsp. vulgare]